MKGLKTFYDFLKVGYDMKGLIQEKYLKMHPYLDECEIIRAAPATYP